MKSRYLKIGLLVVLPPIFIAWVLSILDTNEVWLGYWGGIIGSFLGVLGAFMILREQINNEREQHRKQQIDNTFFNLLSMHNEQITNLNEQQVFRTINIRLSGKLDNAQREAAKTFLKDNQQLIEALNEVKSLFEEYISTNESHIPDSYKTAYEVCWVKNRRELPFSGDDIPILKSIVTAIKRILEIEKIFQTEIRGYVPKHGDIYTKLRFINEDLDELRLYKPDAFKKIYVEILRFEYRNYTLIDKGIRNKLVEEALSDYYKEIGSYFRLFHRIIKYLNNSLQKADEQSLKNDYIGFLRASVNQKEMLVIFYNAAYTSKGEGLLHELQKTTFFGTKEDIERDQHFERSALFWEKEDVDIMLNKAL